MPTADVNRLEAALDWAVTLDTESIAAHIQEIGFECTRCGRCCQASGEDPHTATVFPDEIRTIRASTDLAWDDIARPMPYGLSDGTGETFEWALQTGGDGRCTFLEDETAGTTCEMYESRPLLCRTYPFSLALPGTGISEDAAVAAAGRVRASQCPGLGAEMSRKRALAIADTLVERAKTELRETIALRETYTPRPDATGTVVHDSEGPKRPDGRLLTSQGDNY